MQKIFMLVVLSVLSVFVTQSQEVVNATRLRWASGPCCSRGTSYAVYLCLDRQHIGTVEVEKVYLPGTSAVEGEVRLDYAQYGGVTYAITFGIAHDDRNNDWPYPERMPSTHVEVVEEKDIREFQGEALLILRINGRLTEVPVMEFAELPSIARP